MREERTLMVTTPEPSRVRRRNWRGRAAAVDSPIAALLGRIRVGFRWFRKLLVQLVVPVKEPVVRGVVELSGGGESGAGLECGDGVAGLGSDLAVQCTVVEAEIPKPVLN